MGKNKGTFSEGSRGRRSFLKKSAAGAAALAGNRWLSPAAGLSAFSPEESPALPWYRRVTRWGQINITEKDPEQYDISWWRSYWKQTATEGIVVNAGGIVAYYPTAIVLQQKALYLNGRDLFGELVKAAREEGVAVFARMDSNRAHEAFFRAHPDWFAMDDAGKPYKAGELYISCINSPYYEEHIPSILREIASKYHPDGFTDNSWSGLERDSICYCGNCSRRFLEKTGAALPKNRNWNDPVYRQWIRWNYDRRLEIWDLNNRVTRAAGGPDCIWAGMNSGSISGQSNSFRDYKAICERAEIIMLDNQARSDSSGFQRNADIGQIVHGLLGWEKLIPESMAMYQAGRPTFRVSSKPEAEARMWMTEGAAGGIQPWWHMVGAYHEDRRMYHTAGPFMHWHKNNTSFLINRKPVASIGVVWSQENTDFYGRDEAHEKVDLPWQGITQALIRARIPYLPVHADHIDRDGGQLSLLILPNLAILNDDQLATLRRFVALGGGLFATGETSLFDEEGNARTDYALAALFGAYQSGDRDSPTAVTLEDDETRHNYLRLSPEWRARVPGPHNRQEPAAGGQRHEVLRGFDETDILPFGGRLKNLRTATHTDVPLTLIPAFPIYPPETAWMRVPKTDIPALVLHTENSGARIAFMPADIDRQFALYNLPDHGNLLANIIRWAAKDNVPIQVQGKGLVDCHLYSQPGRLLLHVVNLTSAGTWRQPVHDLIAVGPFHITVQLPADVRGTRLTSLVSGNRIPLRVNAGKAELELSSITDHEVLLIS